MRELIQIIPYLDLTIIALLFFFLYLGWNHGTPRLLMVIGSIYTGFLLSAIYYHLFAVMLTGFFKLQSVFVADRPADVSLDLGDATMAEQPDDAEAMLWFCVDRESVGRRRPQVIGAARQDHHGRCR